MQVLVLLVSFFACTVGAICGIGGGIIIKPVLDATGVADVATINFLSGCTVLSMTLYSVLKAKLSGTSTIDPKTDTPLAIGAAVGGLAGKELFSIVASLFPDPNTAGAVQAGLLLVITLGTLVYTIYKEKIPTLKTPVENCEKMNKQFETSRVFLASMRVLAETDSVSLANAFAATIRQRMKKEPIRAVHTDPGKVCITRHYCGHMEEAIVQQILATSGGERCCLLTTTNDEALQLTGLLLKHTLFVGEPAPFVLELPLYHIPRVTTVLKQAWERLQRFLFRAGKVLVVMVLFLSICDKVHVPNPYAKPSQPNPPAKISIIEFVGRTISPVFLPMGVERDNWQGSVALIVGLFAKEQVVSSLNTLYAIEGGTADTPSAQDEALTWASARDQLLQGVTEAVATIPEAFTGLMDSLLDPLGVGIFKSEYERARRLAEQLADPTLSQERLADLQRQIDVALDIEALHEALTKATVTKEAMEKQVARNEALRPQLEAAEAELNATATRLGKASVLQSLAKRITSGSVSDARGRNLVLRDFNAQIETYYQESLSEEVEADTTLMNTLVAKFDSDKNRAFAYLLFVLLYVPCLAAMATVVREIGWGYSSILFGYLTVLGWCVATLYFQITTGHSLAWIITPCVFLAATVAFFYALGKKIKVRLVV